MKKKILTICLIACLAAIAIVGGSLAYFTDTDEDTNVFVSGNVAIDQFELQRDENDGLEDFADNKVVVPAAGDPAYPDPEFQWGDAGYTTQNGGELVGGNQLWAAHMNAQDKVVFVENTGNNDVYYRTIIALECPEGITLRTNVNGHQFFDWDPATAGQQNGNSTKAYIVTVNNVRYEVIVATYTEVLTPDEVSRPSLLQYALDKTTTQEQVAGFGGDGIVVYTFTEAVQADGFSDLYSEDVACSALNDAFGAIDEAYLSTLIGNAGN